MVLFSAIQKEFCMAAGTGGIQGLPNSIFVTLHTGYIFVIGIQSKARHGVMVKQEIFSFPANGTVTLRAICA